MTRIIALFALTLAAFSANAELVLRQSTADQAVVIGPFLDSTDGNTAETGLTISNSDVRLSKNGANIVGKNSGGCEHDELGYYTCTFDATDTDTVGRLQVMVHESGALPVYHEFQVAEEAVYDACCAADAAPLSASTIRLAVGLANANLDTQLGTIDSNVDSILDDTGTSGVVVATSSKTGYSLSSSQTFNLTGNISGSVGSVTGNVGGTVNGLTSTAQGHVRTAVGLSSANLDTQLSTIAGYIDTEIASLLDGVNVTHQTGIEICGSGTEADPWGACEE